MSPIVVNYNYLLKNHCIGFSIHVFTLIFIDAILSTVGSFITCLIYLFNISDHSLFGCTLFFFSSYLPWLCGAFLTLTIATVRD